jgi:NAD-dependent deacetylase
MTPEGLARAAEALLRAHRVVVSTGAGMSRESGIPTFRDAQEGLWARFSPQELATEQGFRANPARVWTWYAERRRRIRACAPHAGHHALVAMERIVPELTVVTQNIDGLHREAGSADVIELHGNIRRFKCLNRHHLFSGEPDDAEQDGAEVAPPPCPRCGSPLRPDVVWFGEMLPEDATDRAWDLARRSDVMLVVGTSGTVWPAAGLPLLARDAGAVVIEVGPEPSEITRVAHTFLEGPAGVVLPALVAAMEERHPSG